MKENQRKVSKSAIKSENALNEKEDFIMLPTVDFCFKELMQNENVRKGIIAAILNRRPDEIVNTELLPTILRKDSEDDKYGILDVRVQLDNEVQIDFEMQVVYYDFWANRTIYYLSKMYTEQIREGDSYDRLQKCIQVSILAHVLFQEDDECYRRISFCDVKTGKEYTDLMSMPYSQWAPIMEYVIIGGSVIFWILLLQSGKEKRRAYGLNSEHWNISIRMILLFIGLYLLRFVIASALSGQLSEFGKIMANPTTWIIFFTVLVNFFLSVVAFFGEEYGWRYYLQPLLQKKFGLKGGVILLGCVWAVWHLPIDFFYYTTPDMGLAALASQFITCISLGIFMAYTYMKTQNIWVPIIIHFLNNNMVVVFSGTYSADVLQNQQIHWGDIPVALVMNLLIFGWVIFLKPFKEKKA